HSYIAPVSFATTSESSALIIRGFSEKGTLRDHIYKVKPKEPFLKKYCNPKKIQGLEPEQIRNYGRQILEALKFLHDKGFPYGHLHASNVLLEEDTCKLLEIENSVLGLPSYYRPYVTQFRKINTTESIDVYAFGHLLYEMTYGRPPDSVPVDQWPPAPFSSVGQFHSELKDLFSNGSPFQSGGAGTANTVSVLQSILSTDACKTGMPSVSQLLQTHLFNDVLLFNSEKPQFKISSRLKEALKLSRESLEKRLVEEQRTIHQHKRLTRAQSHHGSEEEKRKRKMLARKKSRQSTYEIEEDLSVKCNNNSGSGASSPPTCPSSPTPLPGSGTQNLSFHLYIQGIQITGAPLPIAPPPPPPSPPPPSSNPTPPSLSPPGASSTGRGALLSSINSFNKGKLKRANTVDRSGPRL
ncbi:hypothetical protein DNTS_022963, partial [Danionella cerebrum]